MNTRMLSPRYEQNGVVEVYLDAGQERARAEVANKLRNGTYRCSERPCVVCQQEQFVAIAFRDRYALPVTTQICRTCGLVQANPVMREQDYVDFYTRHYRALYTGADVPIEEFFREQQRRGRTLWQFLSRAVPLGTGARVLEVGCGAGGILDAFREGVAVAIGLDVDSRYLAYGKSRGLDLRSGQLQDIHAGMSFDLVIYSHVLEHVVDIANELARVREKLSPGGALLIEVPGVYSIPAQYGGNGLKYLQNAHLYYFTRRSLTNLLTRQGFRLVAADEWVRAVFQRSDGPQMDGPSEYPTVLEYLVSLEAAYLRRHPIARRRLAKLANATKRRVARLRSSLRRATNRADAG